MAKRIAELCLLLVFFFSLYKLVGIGYQYYRGDQVYDTAVESFVTEETEPSLPFSKKVDFEALQKTNPEVVGWICIPNTAVNYPVLYTNNNQYYLKHTYNRAYSDFGSIFIAAECSPDGCQKHTIVYGHNTKNGSMFGSLKKYKDASFFRNHPYIYILQPNRLLEYRVVSAYTAETSDDIYSVHPKHFKKWLQSVVSLSTVPTDYTVTGTEQVLTLSTCTSRTKTERFVVNGVLQETYSLS